MSVSKKPRVAVVGLGAAGAAALWRLARAGCEAVGIDQFAPLHDRGSSHGQTRLLRVAYAEGERYVPLVRRAIGLWRELEAEAGLRLFHQSGVFYAGGRSSVFLTASLASAKAHRVGLDMLDGPAPVKSGLVIPSHWTSFVERDGGFIESDAAIDACLLLARRTGASVIQQRVLGVESDASGVTIRTRDGVIAADVAVVAAGAWASDLLPEIRPHLAIERRVLHWFADPSGAHAHGAGFRPFIVDADEAGDGVEFYGFPAIDGRGVKAAEHDVRSLVVAPVASADDIDRHVGEDERARVAVHVRRFLPALDPRPIASSVCMYPMSADGHFIIDRLASSPRVIVGVGLSGHGFKFMPLIGGALASLALGEALPADMGFLQLKRFGA